MKIIVGNSWEARWSSFWVSNLQASGQLSVQSLDIVGPTAQRQTSRLWSTYDSKLPVGANVSMNGSCLFLYELAL